DPSDAAYQSLPDGQTAPPLVIPITVTDAAGATDTQNLTITVTGTNDAALISGVDAVTVSEDQAADKLHASGRLSVSDADTGEAGFDLQSGLGSNGYGHFILSPTGAWGYVADNHQTAIQQLGDGQPLTDSFEFHSKDGTTHTVTITIEGTNDAPTVSAAVTDQTTDQGQAFS
ncbi:VCBS domain-containing protein, partial [Pseudomaricurvus sp. HS19]|uniref:VCBS domain-containing protein n=1 Tax=Pseudomaricurvus sp. HS19 TaxID=2692626 RepID=UPI0013AB4871